MEYYSSYNSPPYPESDESSPQSREIDFENTNPPPWDDDRSQNSNSNNQPPPVKLMCSFGGKIQPRPNDNQLSYVGGHTKILAVDRGAKFASLLAKLAAMCDSDVKTISFKYQLPGEDLDALISVTDDEDFDHMMHEHDRLSSRVSNHKPARLRIFIFPMVHDPSLRSSSDGQVKSEKERFVEALNSAPIIAAPQQSAAGNVDFLFGLEKSSADPAAAGVTGVVDERFGGLDPIQKHIQDLHRLRIEEEEQQQEGMSTARGKEPMESVWSQESEDTFQTKDLMDTGDIQSLREKFNTIERKQQSSHQEPLSAQYHDAILRMSAGVFQNPFAPEEAVFMHQEEEEPQQNDNMEYPALNRFKRKMQEHTEHAHPGEIIEP